MIGRVIYNELHVSKAALWRKMVLSKPLSTLPTSSDGERKLVEFFRKNVAVFPKQDSACPDQRFQGKLIKLSFFSVQFFGTLSGYTIDSSEIFTALFQKLRPTRPEVQFWELFWDKLEKFLNYCIVLSEKFPEGLSKLLFMTSQEHFGTKIFFHYSFLIFSLFQTLS